MKHRVHVLYSVPVDVVVDLIAEEVVDVQIRDFDKARSPTVLNENHDERIEPGDSYRALRIAKEKEWPEWGFAALPWWITDKKKKEKA